MKRLQIKIVVDINDADYVTSINDITEEEINVIRPLIKEIIANKSDHNYLTEDLCRPDLGEISADEYYKDKVSEKALFIFNRLLPQCDYGMHTIKSVEILELVKIEKLI